MKFLICSDIHGSAYYCRKLIEAIDREKADRVIVMNEGKVVLDGAPREVFTEIDLLKKIGLDVPEATELTDMLNKDGFGFDKHILDIDELFDEIVRIKEGVN